MRAEFKWPRWKDELIAGRNVYLAIAHSFLQDFRKHMQILKTALDLNVAVDRDRISYGHQFVLEFVFTVDKDF